MQGGHVRPLRLARAVARRLARCFRARQGYAGYRSFSQEGEDMILRSMFSTKPRGYHGFYVDVGAHDPERFSNTLCLYLAGWRGINIDARPGGMTAFRRRRPRDINLELAIGASRSTLTYYCFNDPALNGFRADIAKAIDEAGRFRLTSQVQLETVPLSDVLDEYLPEGQAIDLLTVDVEGMDYEVLSSNDWARYRPDVVLSKQLE